MLLPHPPVFASLSELTAPQTLRALLGLPEGAWTVFINQMEGGLSGATLERISLSNGDLFANAVLKHINAGTNWLMHASGDARGREIAFTQSDLWERMPQAIRVPVLGVAQWSAGEGALLMPDLTPVVYPSSLCYEPADEHLVARIIDHLAAMHAAFWEYPGLRDHPWLATPADAFLTLTVERLGQSTGMQPGIDTYGDQAMRMWPYLWRFLDDEDGTTIWHTLMNPSALLAAAGAAPATLAHGDTWIANMGGLSPTPLHDATADLARAQGEAAPVEQLVLLDWALVTAGPATFDSLWLAHTWHTLDPLHTLELHRAALLRHGVTAVQDDATWALLCDLGWVRTFLMGAEWMVRDVRGSQTDEEDRDARARLASWARRAVEIIRARGW